MKLDLKDPQIKLLLENWDPEDIDNSWDPMIGLLNYKLESVQVNKAEPYFIWYDSYKTPIEIDLRIEVNHPYLFNGECILTNKDIHAFIKDLEEAEFPTQEEAIKEFFENKDIEYALVSLDILKKYKLYTHKDFYKFEITTTQNNYWEIP